VVGHGKNPLFFAKATMERIATVLTRMPP
jgi:hypothetical protein